LSRLAASGLNWEPATMFVVGALLLVFEAWRWKGEPFGAGWFGASGLLCMWWGSAHLVKLPLQIDPQAAEIGVALFAVIAVPLLAVAFQAKRNKAVL
jgi:hypothetical protein